MDSKLARANALALALLGLGLAQLVGLLAGSPVLRGLGAASAASPLPKVFSDVDGLETFATTFTLAYEVDGETVESPVTPEYYSRLGGPYNRRNVYGAALAYGPRLPEEIWTAVFCFGLEERGPFRIELGIPARAENVRVRIDALTKRRDGSWTLEPRCNR